MRLRSQTRSCEGLSLPISPCVVFQGQGLHGHGLRTLVWPSACPTVTCKKWNDLSRGHPIFPMSTNAQTQHFECGGWRCLIRRAGAGACVSRTSRGAFGTSPLIIWLLAVIRLLLLAHCFSVYRLQGVVPCLPHVVLGAVISADDPAGGASRQSVGRPGVVAMLEDGGPSEGPLVQHRSYIGRIGETELAVERDASRGAVQQFV